MRARPGRFSLLARGETRLSTLYLVRHGQAGTRDAYDSLSGLGKRQCRALGKHLLAQGIRFTACYSGALVRQQETAAEVKQAYANADVRFPTITVDPAWNEFDLKRVSDEIAPQLCAQDAAFRREFEEMQQRVRISNGAHDAAIHRHWMPCDTKIVQAWIQGRFAYSGESWQEFRERIVSCRSKLSGSRERENFLVFTSATPIAIWTGLSLDLLDARVMRLAGVLYNASYTILRLRDGGLQLFTFNALPQLPASERTHR
jgi:broad specificity phosphatase PhoE